MKLSKIPPSLCGLRTKSRARWAAALALAALALPLPLHAVTLDPSFGAGSGISTTDISGTTDSPAAVTVQSDGKILVVGSCSASTRLCIARYLANGSLDTAGFNATAFITERGKRVLPQPTTVGSFAENNNAYSVAALANGKILIGGGCASRPCVMQLLADGSTDSNFGASGILYVDANATTYGRISAITQRANGRVVLAGVCGSRLCVLQLLSDGSRDPDFGTNGKVVLNPTQLNDDYYVQTSESALSLTLQADGKMIAWGTCSTTTGFAPNKVTTHFSCAQRLGSTGISDTSFGWLGGEWRSYGFQMTAASGPMPEGQTMLAATCESGSPPVSRPCLIRVLATGELDPTFGNGINGTYTFAATALSSATNQYIISLAVPPDGKTFAAIQCSFPTGHHICVARHNTDGSFDTTFDVDGAIGHTAGSAGATPRAAALQPDGKLLVASECTGSGGTDFCVSRYLPGANYARNCTMDLDGDGKVLATTDMLMATRIALGLTGTAVTTGVSFSAAAMRNTWPLIREYLINHCAMKLP